MPSSIAFHFDSRILLVTVSVMFGLLIDPNYAMVEFTVGPLESVTASYGGRRSLMKMNNSLSLRFAKCSFQVNRLRSITSYMSTQFFLFTKQNRQTFQKLVAGKVKRLNRSNFDPSRRTKMVIHGWLDGYCATTWMEAMKNELLENDDYNVIIVDWGGASKSTYEIALLTSYRVGDETAHMIHFLQRQTGVDPGSFHVIGHSLGAQAASRVGKLVEGLGRISGLDPALTYFMNFPDNLRLVPRDAQFVDVIYSNFGRSSYVANESQIPQTGHVDFYPNGGHLQPGCAGIMKGMPSPGQRLFDGLAQTKFCAHFRAVYMFIFSINTCRFMCKACSNYNVFRQGACGICDVQSTTDCAFLGFPADNINAQTLIAHPRKYYLNTIATSPYCGIDERIDDIIR